MRYASVLVHLDLGVDNGPLLKIAGDLTTQFEARAIGVVAAQPVQVLAGDAYISGELIDTDRLETERMMGEAEAAFRAALSGRGRDVGWRSIVAMGALAGFIAREARSSDIVLASLGAPGGLDPVRRVNIGDLSMALGRPLLLAPPGVDSLRLETAVIGWKDARETRRALADALPLLEKAGRVVLLQIVHDADRKSAAAQADDVLSWLKLHGVEAVSAIEAARGDDSSQLIEYLARVKAGLFVAGAYGHSRLREWAFGGVTRHLLSGTPCLTLLTH